MKKISAMLLALLLLMMSAASAEVDLSQYSVTNASVQTVDHLDITAPCAGTLLPFDLETGDVVAVDDLLFSLMTVDVYAPEDGEVTAVFVEAGDDAAAAMNRYGSLGAIDPTVEQMMNCTTLGAHNSDENKVLHVGETLYFKSPKSDGDKGTGRVTAVTASGYTVEILSGHFSKGDSMSLYRDKGYNSRDCVGKGIVSQRLPVTFSATGMVTAVYVQPGTKVKAGDRLLSLLPNTNDHGVMPDVNAPCSGVIGTVSAAPGQQVWKGALLCRLYLTDAMEIVADVDEMDLNALSVGSPVYVTLDTDKKNVLTGQVTEISSTGIIRGNAAYYTVHVSLPKSKEYMIGQSASLYLPKN